MTAFDVQLSDQVWIAILILPLIFFTWIRNLDTLAIFSAIANLCIVFSLVVIFYEEVYRFTTDYPPEKAAVRTESFPLFTLGSLPLFFGTAVYAYEGIGAVSVGRLGWGSRESAGVGGWRHSQEGVGGGGGGIPMRGVREGVCRGGGGGEGERWSAWGEGSVGQGRGGEEGFCRQTEGEELSSCVPLG